MVVITALIDAPGLGPDDHPGAGAGQRRRGVRRRPGDRDPGGRAGPPDRRAGERMDPRDRSVRASRVRRRAAVLARRAAVAIAAAVAGALAAGRGGVPGRRAALVRGPGQRRHRLDQARTCSTAPRASRTASARSCSTRSRACSRPPRGGSSSRVVLGLGAGSAGRRAVGDRRRLPAASWSLLGLWEHAHADARDGAGRDRRSRWSSACCSASGRPAATGSRRVLRPLLDAAQTMPSFVYLLPAVALFGAEPVHGDRRGGDLRRAAGGPAGRRRHPRRLADGRRGGDGRPAPRRASCCGRCSCRCRAAALLLAANQGIVMVLAMVVVGGLVGAGALGYDVVAGLRPARGLRQGSRRGLRDRAAGHHARPDHAGRRRPRATDRSRTAAPAARGRASDAPTALRQASRRRRRCDRIA